ncbi:nitrite reductase (NAD(P)H) small subunit [Streptomyces corynorhini]|uniref:Nitrite reductase (NAD(P)H) small subunit n=1 Tax=Streptomyces corynorhini TaxID=2282652 RepID=A0A370B5P2_9ACTN|nr:nitrite reductase (NAD(P)H) small subunit [Streptomyces corynorhini]
MSVLEILIGDGEEGEPGEWFAVCEPSALTPGRGVAVLLPGGRQAAVFLDRAGVPYAVANQDPFSGAYVLSRGLTGTHEGRFFVASPLLKQRFDLATGRCLDDEGVAVQAYRTRVRVPVREPEAVRERVREPEPERERVRVREPEPEPVRT